MSEFADPGLCPRCGSDQYVGGLTTAVRTCHDCGARYRPRARGWERGLVAGVLLVPSFLGLGVFLFLVAVLVAAPPRDGGLAAAGCACAALTLAASAAGLFFGFRELGGRRTTVALADPDPVKSGRLVPRARARAIVRELADAHAAGHIAAQLDWIEPARIANARARFAAAMTSEETPLVLFDTSFLRNGKSGFLLTNRAFYSSRLAVPMPLEDVRTATHRPPNAGAVTYLYAIVGLSFCLPVISLLVLPVLLDRKRPLSNRLLINDRLAYAGGKSLAWGFWTDVLPTLAAAVVDGPTPDRVAVLETFPGGEARAITNPPVRDPAWPDIEATIRSLDGVSNPGVRLWVGEPGRSAGLEVMGGAGKYALRELPDGWVYYDPVGGDEEVEVSVGELGHRCPAYSVCADVERVVEIARGFVTTGAFE